VRQDIVDTVGGGRLHPVTCIPGGMSKSVKNVAKRVVKDGAIKDSKLYLFEMAIRCYDPCLSCSTHSYGKMPLKIELRNPQGETTQVAWHGKQTP